MATTTISARFQIVIPKEVRDKLREWGWQADLAVLTENYLRIPEDRIKQLGSDLTMLGGNVVHARGRFKSLL